MRLGDRLDDGQPQPDAACLSAARAVGAIEAVEKTPGFFGRHDRAAVGHRKNSLAAHDAGLHGEPSPGLVVSDGVLHEVTHQPLQQRRVAVERCAPQVEFEA